MLQSEAAVLLGVSESQISRLVTGQRKPSTAMMEKVERHLRWPVDAQLKALNNEYWWADFKDKMDRVVSRA